MQLIAGFETNAMETQMEIVYARWIPLIAEWLSQKINEDLKAANILVNTEIRKFSKSWIDCKKW
jgi:hypothetical protein